MAIGRNIVPQGILEDPLLIGQWVTFLAAFLDII